VSHETAGSGDYTLTYGGGVGQNGWRWCRRCGHLWYGLQGPGICPAGGGHDSAGSGDYWIPHNDWSHPGQKGWKWCCRCQVLFYSGQGLGRCPGGSSHDPTGSGEYSLTHVPLSGAGAMAIPSVSTMPPSFRTMPPSGGMMPPSGGMMAPSGGMMAPSVGMMAPGTVQYQQTTVTTTVTTPGTPATIPQSYMPPQFTYTTVYSPTIPFVLPIGIDQRVANRMLQASAIFRQYDKNRSGTLSYKEWKKAMKHLGYQMSKPDKMRLFMMIDSDGSGSISEREFCEFWAVYGWP